MNLVGHYRKLTPFHSVSSADGAMLGRMKTRMNFVLPVLLCAVAGLAQPGSYRPVAPQPQKGPPCGHYGTAPCPEAVENVTIPPNATPDQLFDLGQRALSQRRRSASFQYMLAAAEKGHTRAQAAVGLDYVNGKGTAVDLQKAIVWLSKAADKGHRVAQAQLGDIYEDGDGIPLDFAKAFRYHSLGAAQGWWQAELRLGLDYELGYGTSHNRAAALQWLNRAMVHGQDGLSQDLISMLGRPDCPPRFASEPAMWNHLGKLRGEAMPKFSGKSGCRDAMGRVAPSAKECVTPVGMP